MFSSDLRVKMANVEDQVDKEKENTSNNEITLKIKDLFGEEILQAFKSEYSCILSFVTFCMYPSIERSYDCVILSQTRGGS